MADKYILVLTQFIDNDYNTDIINGIRRYFEGKPINLVVLEVRDPSDESAAFGYQYWNIMSLTKTKNIDGIILITGTYCSKYTIDEIKSLFESYFDTAVVSVSIDIPFKNGYYTKVDSESGYREVMSHLVNVHHKKRIGFVSANLTNSVEGKIRFESYKKVLAENNLPFDQSIVIDSNYLMQTTMDIMQEKYHSKEDITFDALICANDSMAFGAIYFLQQLGFNIPDDIAVIGFDDSASAIRFTPSLSSINQQIDEQGFAAAKMIDEISDGKKVPKFTEVAVKPIYRNSCCSDVKSSHIDTKTEAEKFVEYEINFVHINSLLEKVQFSQTPAEVYNLLARVLSEVEVSAFALCVYDEPISVSMGEHFVLPDEIKLVMAFDTTTNFQVLNGSQVFNPKETVIPPGIINNAGGCYFARAIFYGEKQYGYILYRPGKKTNMLYNIYFKIISNVITSALDYYTSLKKNNELVIQNDALINDNNELDIESKTDELTGVLNRRGFLDLGQKTINLAIQQKLTGLVFFGDMDGLKKINDTFGHETGDLAIKTEANVLKRIFRSNDVIGRLGGDEFAIVAAGTNMKFLDKVSNAVTQLCEEWKKANNAQFDISISLGAVQFDEEHFILQDLLSVADERQYEIKRQKHAERK